MVKLVNRAKMTTATTGTGTITLGVASDGFQAFNTAGVADGDVVRYVIEDGDAFEIGTGTFDATGGTLTRTPSESSIGGGLLTLTGEATVFVGATAEDFDTYTQAQSDARFLRVTNNLSDLDDAATARANLGAVSTGKAIAMAIVFGG